MARQPPRVRAFVVAVSRQDVPVLAVHARDPSRALSGSRPKACVARARHTGPNTTFVKPWGYFRLVGEPNTEGRRSQDPKGREKDSRECASGIGTCRMRTL